MSGKLPEVNDRSIVTKTELEAPSQQSEHKHGDDHGHGFAWQDGVCILLVAIAAALVWFRVSEPFVRVSIVGVAGSADREVRRCGLDYDDALLLEWIDDFDIE